ncbi:MoxR family ATPase [Congzhengia sp.]|uniref:AAA family ATPase n=1 Tax=Congzhengia sp. TaxID=2944168 RepID=UPI003076CB36
MDLKSAQERIKSAADNISKVVVGKEDVILKILSALCAGGHVLLEDVPGAGKTVLAKSLAKSFGAAFSRIQFTPDLLPSDVTGLSIYNRKTEEFVFSPGPVFCNILLADEINRATPRTQSGLLECMEERQVTTDGVVRRLEEPFFVIATQNPVETAGTFPLPEAQLDRFLMKLSLGYPSKEEELAIMERFMSASPLDGLEPVVSVSELVEIQAAAKQVFVHPAVLDYIAELSARTRRLTSLCTGISPRAVLGLLGCVRGYALCRGREFVTPDDVKELAPACLCHRLIVTADTSAEHIIGDVLEAVPVPTEEWGVA